MGFDADPRPQPHPPTVTRPATPKLYCFCLLRRLEFLRTIQTCAGDGQGVSGHHRKRRQTWYRIRQVSRDPSRAGAHVVQNYNASRETAALNAALMAPAPNRFEEQREVAQSPKRYRARRDAQSAVGRISLRLPSRTGEDPADREMR
jgi:hypothetical protein